MISWKEFLESVESDEERNGLDTDHDNERGESPEHKKKVADAKKKTIDFFEDRRRGAANIASQARSKGGPSMLTYWHFAAKNQPYQDVLAAIRRNEDRNWFRNKCMNYIHKLKPGMKQHEFQVLMGQLEVYGEAMAELWN